MFAAMTMMAVRFCGHAKSESLTPPKTRSSVHLENCNDRTSKSLVCYEKIKYRRILVGRIPLMCAKRPNRPGRGRSKGIYGSALWIKADTTMRLTMEALDVKSVRFWSGCVPTSWKGFTNDRPGFGRFISLLYRLLFRTWKNPYQRLGTCRSLII